jgi:uncharacterized membrane protein
VANTRILEALMLSRFPFPLFALTLAACGGGERPTPAASPQEEAPAAAPAPQVPARAPDLFLRGTVRLEPVPMFRSCDVEIHAAFHDSTAIGIIPTYRILAATEEEGLYVLARGNLSPQGEPILREVEFAALPSATDGCEQPTPNYILLARGIDPAWRVTVADAGIEFTETESTSFQLPPVSPRESGSQTVYETSSVAGDPHTLTLTLQRTACHEGNRTYSGMRADVVIDGRSLTGCAWRGALP